jgi:hypothetical protein
VIPIGGAVLALLLVSLGYGFWRHVRQAFAADADGAVARRLRRHSEQRGVVPMDVHTLRTNVAELAARLEGLAQGIAAEFARATGFEPADPSIARTVRAAAARISERGGIFFPRGLRSLEQMIGSLLLGGAGFLLLALLSGLLYGGLATSFRSAPAFASMPAPPMALAATLLFAIGGYLLRDAVYGSNHAATLRIAIPHPSGRRLAAWVTGTALVAGTIFLGGLGAAGQPIAAGATMRALYLMILGASTAAVATNLDGWLVGAYKLAYLIVNAAGWLALGSLRAAVVTADWLVALAVEAVVVLSVPGHWVRMKAFRPA